MLICTFSSLFSCVCKRPPLHLLKAQKHSALQKQLNALQAQRRTLMQEHDKKVENQKHVKGLSTHNTQLVRNINKKQMQLDAEINQAVTQLDCARKAKEKLLQQKAEQQKKQEQLHKRGAAIEENAKALRVKMAILEATRSDGYAAPDSIAGNSEPKNRLSIFMQLANAPETNEAGNLSIDQR